MSNLHNPFSFSSGGGADKVVYNWKSYQQCQYDVHLLHCQIFAATPFVNCEGVC